MGDGDWLDLPYGERQKIVVVPDQIADELRDLAPVDAAQAPIWRRWGPLRRTPEDLEKLPPQVLRLVTARTKLAEEGQELRFVSQSQSAEVRFDAPGHPLPNVVYVGHPERRTIYYPAAFFHRELFNERYCELFSLLAHLGATRIRVDASGADSKGFELAIPKFGGVAVNKDQRDSISFEASLPGGEPKLPDEMIWFPFEEHWKSIAELRMKFQLKTFELAFDQKHDFGVTANLESNVGKVKLEMGGRYTDISSVTLHLSGEFA